MVRVMLTDSTRKYLCRVEGLYDQKQYMSFATIFYGRVLRPGTLLFFFQISQNFDLLPQNFDLLTRNFDLLS